jgi:hypothetical protein
MSQPSRLTPDELYALVRLFYAQPQVLGHFEEVLISRMPEPFRELLAHTEHMTVTVEQFHNSPVDVHVLDTLVTPTHYARKITLSRQRDGCVVQFGIMRVNLRLLPPEVRREIEAQQTPLGRILIEHDVMRKIHLMSLWEVLPGEDLCRIFGLSSPQVTYGRAAVIDCNGEPAIELLEIVTPGEA